jgi:hypothetical protein
MPRYRHIILVWRCMVLERQVLLTSTQLYILTATASEFSCHCSFLSLVACLHSLATSFPNSFSRLPCPFWCGINKANQLMPLYDLSRECVVDLDNLVTLGPELAVPPIPPVQEAALRSQLETMVWSFARPGR